MNISERVKMREMTRSCHGVFGVVIVAQAAHVVLAAPVVPPEVGAAVHCAVTLAAMPSCVYFVVHA